MSQQNSHQPVRSIKITTVGDGTVGKTCLLCTFVLNEFPEEYIPTIFDNSAKAIVVDDVEFSLTLWDTAGQETYEKLRPLSYPKTNVFLLCYAVNNRASFANIETLWIPELKFHCPDAAIILVATKSDLPVVVTEAEGKKMKTKMGAHGFIQCSAKTRAGVEEVFHEAVRAVMNKKSGSRWCNCL